MVRLQYYCEILSRCVKLFCLCKKTFGLIIGEINNNTNGINLTAIGMVPMIPRASDLVMGVLATDYKKL